MLCGVPYSKFPPGHVVTWQTRADWSSWIQCCDLTRLRLLLLVLVARRSTSRHSYMWVLRYLIKKMRKLHIFKTILEVKWAHTRTNLKEKMKLSMYHQRRNKSREHVRRHIKERTISFQRKMKKKESVDSSLCPSPILYYLCARCLECTLWHSNIVRTRRLVWLIQSM